MKVKQETARIYKMPRKLKLSECRNRLQPSSPIDFFVRHCNIVTNNSIIMNGSSNMHRSQHMYCDIRNLPKGILEQRTYENAIAILKCLNRKNFYLELSPEKRHIYDAFKLPIVRSCLWSLEIPLDKLDKLSIIHVTGTKGKGSTCTYTEKILRTNGYTTGLFTSPHIFDERDRIQINGERLSKEQFQDYFWHCFDAIKEVHNPLLPNFFQFMTVMAFHVFLKENVNVVVLEVGIGGENDCTNVIRNPVACGITHLGIDHKAYLGETRESIAWHKAGIFKPGATAITIKQHDVALKVLCERAQEKKCSLYFAPQLQTDNNQILQEREDFELENMSLAIQLARVWLQNHGKAASERKWVNVFSGETVPEIDKDETVMQNFTTILQFLKLPGRVQIFPVGNITYYIDGAHTNASMKCCRAWFKKKSKIQSTDKNSGIKKVLLFSESGRRDPKAMLEILKECHFDLVMFVCNRLNVDDDTENENQYNDLIKTWTSLFEMDYTNTSETKKIKLDNSNTVKGFLCIRDALKWCQLNMANIRKGNPSGTSPALKGVTHLEILITGSLYLVAGVLKYLNINPND